MNLGDLVIGRGAPGADGPDRLIGDDGIGGGRGIGYRTGKLGRDHVERLAAVALGLGLADADHRDQPGTVGGPGLGGDLRIGLSMVGAALGMAEDDMARARIAQHGGADIAGMGAGILRVAILPADGDLARMGDSRRDQRGGRADQHVAAIVARGNRVKLCQCGGQAVHLPVSGGEFLRGHHVLLWLEGGIGPHGPAFKPAGRSLCHCDPA